MKSLVLLFLNSYVVCINIVFSREGHIYSVYIILRYLLRNIIKISGGLTYNPMYDPTDKNVFEVAGRYLDEWKYFILLLRI